MTVLSVETESNTFVFETAGKKRGHRKMPLGNTCTMPDRKTTPH